MAALIFCESIEAFVVFYFIHSALAMAATLVAANASARARKCREDRRVSGILSLTILFVIARDRC